MSNFAVVLDIDGVLLHDYHPIPGAVEAIQYFQNNKIPYVLVTNGGGRIEENAAKKYANAIGIPIPSEHFILSHTPMKALVHKFQKDKILVVGHSREDSINVMKSYGFQNFVFIQDYINEHLFLCPELAKDKNELKVRDTSNEESIKAIFVLSNPKDWQSCIQVMCDFLASNGKLGEMSKEQVVELFVANPDLVYAGKFPIPRFTVGAFIECLKHLYETFYGKSLRLTYFGKPQKETYDYVKGVLTNFAQKNNIEKFDRIYAIGDNPLSDIKGANHAGPEWFSILVRTGCFKGEENDPENPAKFVCESIKEALEFILKKENLK